MSKHVNGHLIRCVIKSTAKTSAFNDITVIFSLGFLCHFPVKGSFAASSLREALSHLNV